MVLLACSGSNYLGRDSLQSALVHVRMVVQMESAVESSSDIAGCHGRSPADTVQAALVQ